MKKQNVGAAIFNGGKVLIVKRLESESDWAGFWELPGGGVDSGESLEVALHREILEETQLSIDTNMVPYYTFNYDNTEEFHYIANTNAPEKLKLEPMEHDDYRWISSSSELDGLKMSPELVSSISQALENVNA